MVEVGVKYRVRGRPWGMCRGRGRARDRGDDDVAGGWR